MIVASSCLFLRFPQSGIVIVESVLSIGKVVVGMNELGTAVGAFEMLARGVLEAAGNFGAAFGVVCSLCGNSSGSPAAWGR